MIKLRNPLVVAAIVVVFLSSCGPSREGPKHKSRPQEPPTLERAVTLSLVPVVDGGLYAVDELDGVVWYVSNGKAVRVSGLKAELVNAIIPTAEGGAYIHVTIRGQNGGLWYLKGATATKVEEAPAVVDMKVGPRPTEHWLWAMWQSERLRRESAEQHAENRG